MSSTPAARPPTPTGAHEHSYQDTFTKQLAELHKFISANSDRNPAGRGDARIDQTFKPDRSSTLRMEVKVEDIKQTLYEISNGLKPSSEKMATYIDETRRKMADEYKVTNDTIRHAGKDK